MLWLQSVLRHSSRDGKCRIFCLTPVVCRKGQYTFRNLICQKWLFLFHLDSGPLSDFCILIYLLTAIGLPPSGSSTVLIYTHTIHRTTQNKEYIEQHNNLGECGPCPVLASCTLAFALHLRKRHGKTSVRVEKTSVREEHYSAISFSFVPR